MLMREEIAEPLQAAKRRAVAEHLSRAGVRERGVLPGTTANPRDNVVDVGDGLKLLKGKVTARQAVWHYVPQKLYTELARPEQRLPSVIGGVETDVVEVGPLRPLSEYGSREPWSWTWTRAGQSACSGEMMVTSPSSITLGTF
jgi:hypothetical protein